MRPCYLVALKHVVVAQDIAQTILEHDPEAEVILDRLPPSVPEECAPRIAFLGLSPSESQALPAARALRARGAQLVLIGEEAEAVGESRDWWVLFRPFTSDAVLALLQRATEERESRAPG